ncbi:MAG: hypothetical protein U0P45_01680 [Acidimicrobiales bacterium]
MDASTASGIFTRLQQVGAVAPDASVSPTRGRAEWTERGLLLRLVLHRGPLGELTWVVFVGDPVLGRAFHDGGILALVALRRWSDPAQGDELPWAWPTDEASLAQVVAAFEVVLGRVRTFVPDRRALCGLLLAEEDVHWGGLVADLHGDRAERLVRAIAIGMAANDDVILAAALGELDRAEAEAPADAPSALRNHARFWADQWTWQSGRQIVVPDELPRRLVPDRAGATEVGDFWDRVG